MAARRPPTSLNGGIPERNRPPVLQWGKVDDCEAGHRRGRSFHRKGNDRYVLRDVEAMGRVLLLTEAVETVAQEVVGTIHSAADLLVPVPFFIPTGIADALVSGDPPARHSGRRHPAAGSVDPRVH